MSNYAHKHVCRGAFCQMKKNYQIYSPYQFHWRPQSVGGDSQFPPKKMKTLFLSNMSKSRRLTSTFFPIIDCDYRLWRNQRLKLLCDHDPAFANPLLQKDDGGGVQASDYKTTITFPRAFERTPSVVLSMRHLDAWANGADYGDYYGWTFSVHYVTKVNFQLHIHIHDRWVDQIAGAWVACSY